MKRGLLLFLVVCWVGSLADIAQSAAPVPVEIAPEAARVPVWPALKIVAPVDQDLTPDQAADMAAGNSAITVDSPNRIVGRGTSPYWALFSLSNPAASAQLRLLAVETTTQLDIRLFERNETGTWRQAISVAEAAAGRIGGGTSHPVWALHLAPRQATELLLRIEGPAVVRFPVFIYDPVSFAERERRASIAIGIALGSCLFILVYTASLRRYLDDAAVSLFIYMIIADIVGALWLSGFLSVLFPSLSENILSPIGFAAYASLLGCGCLHARIYLNCAAWAPKTDYLLQALGWSWLALAPVFAAAFPVAARIILVWGGAAIAAMLVVVSVRAARRRVRFSGFIAAAWLVYLLGGTSFLFARIIDNPAMWTSSSLVLAQATAAAICFGFAMSQRMLRQRVVLVAARQEAVMQQEKAAALMRERSLLFAATNHDLRQPLLGISLFADMLRTAATLEEREECSRKLGMAIKEADELLLGIQQLAAVNEAGYRPALETVRLDDLLTPLIEEYRGRSEQRNIAIRYVPSRLTITTHVPYFQRIVRNILSNAIRYTERGDRVLVGCRRGGGLRLVIADSGRGMSEDQSRQVFDAFVRFDPEKSIADGFGLGLFSARSLANALGLTISLRSQNGRGTEFGIPLLHS